MGRVRRVVVGVTAVCAAAVCAVMMDDAARGQCVLELGDGLRGHRLIVIGVDREDLGAHVGQ